MFEGATLLITGGTGSFGNAVLDRFLETDIKEIRIFSRDELKQDDMRHYYQRNFPEVSDKIKFYIGDVRDLQSVKNAMHGVDYIFHALKQDDMRHYYQRNFPEVSDKIKFYIGDVRDLQSVKNAMHGVDYIFHAAALKQVPSCEFFPVEAVKTNVLGYIGDVRDLQSVKNAMHGVDYIFHAAALKQVPSCEFFPVEAVKTNVLGTENVLTAAIEAGVKKVICLSTDKAAYPVNAMGTSKAMMEKVIVAKSRTVAPEKTEICCTRYGNVMCSRGSVIPLFINQIKEGKDLTVTEPTMTRFIMSLGEAVELVVFAFENGNSGDILVQKAPACTIEVLAQAVKEVFHAENEIKIIGIRHGEKMYETLLTNEECANAIDMGQFYRVPCDKRDLNYDKYFKDGDVKRNTLTEFNSNNTELLGVEEVKEKLLKLPYVQEELKQWEELRK